MCNDLKLIYFTSLSGARNREENFVISYMFKIPIICTVCLTLVSLHSYLEMNIVVEPLK